MTPEISERELRNSSGEVMRALDIGETFVLTHNGVPVGELTPLRRRPQHSNSGLKLQG
jgi:antitoxin (DNA-binding transcriptional repressor) of toxin-antitoxin stability system